MRRLIEPRFGRARPNSPLVELMAHRQVQQSPPQGEKPSGRTLSPSNRTHSRRYGAARRAQNGRYLRASSGSNDHDSRSARPPLNGS
jgi:hypothetical protein